MIKLLVWSLLAVAVLSTVAAQETEIGVENSGDGRQNSTRAAKGKWSLSEEAIRLLL
jgi:hypothetical protein